MDSPNVAAFSKPRRSSRASQDSSRAFSNRRKGNNEPGSSSRNTGINGRKNRSSRASCKSKSGSRRSSRRQNKKSKKKLNSSRTKAANDSVQRLKASPLVAQKAVTENVNHGEEHHCHDVQSFDCHQQGRFPRAPVHSTPPFQSDGFVNYVTLTLPYHIAKAAKQIEREEQIEFEQYRRQYIENRGARLGPPIPLNFDDSDDELDTSGQYSDISDWDPACLHQQKFSDQFAFPLSKCAPKGISARWQEQHPQWRDGRYCIDRMISPASIPPVLSSSLQPFSQRQYQDSRGSTPPAFEVYEDDE